MKNKKLINSSGQIPKGLLILVGLIILVLIIAFIIVKLFSGPEETSTPTEEEGKEEQGQEVQEPVYEVIIDDIRFVFQKAKDKGNILRGSESKYPERQEDLFTKERFIEVTIGAQNVGKEIITEADKKWSLGEIIDGEGRHFQALKREADPWISEESDCGAALKPAFTPTPCTKIYEVAKVSTDLKVKVLVEEKGIATSGKREALIDLKLY